MTSACTPEDLYITPPWAENSIPECDEPTWKGQLGACTASQVIRMLNVARSAVDVDKTCAFHHADAQPVDV